MYLFRLSTTTPKARRSKQVLESSPETEDEISEGNDTNIPSTAIIESDQRMSKEKQKFFRLSAFNPEKRKRNKDVVLTALDSPDNVALRIGRNNNKCALSSDSDSSDDERLPSPSKSVPSATVPKLPTLQTLVQDTKFNVPRSNFKLTGSASLKKCDKLLIPRKVSTSSWSSESSCDESSNSCSSTSSRLSSPHSSPVLTKPLAAVTYNTTFHRLGATGGDKWGFAAEAQKECSLVPRKLESANLQLPALPALPTANTLTTRTFGSFQAQPRNRDRLLTTLYDGLSEFYAVRHGCRVRSSSKVEQTSAERPPPPPPCREVLKETRSTLKNLNDSLKSADNSPSKQTELNNDRLQYKLVPTKDEYLSRAPAPHPTGVYSLKENELVISQDPADLRCDSTPPGALEDRIDMCPSGLVKAAVYAKRHEFGRSDMLKTFNHLNFGMSDSPLLDGHKYLGSGLGSDYNLPTTFELRKQQLIADVSTIKSPLTLVQPSTNRTGKDSSSATRSFTFPPHSIPQALVHFIITYYFTNLVGI